MNLKRSRTRTLATLLIAGTLSLGLAAGAGAAIWIYGNGFSNKATIKELKRSSGGKKCKKRYKQKAKQLRVVFTGQRYCGYSPPVVGDGSQPNHAVFAKGRIVKKGLSKGLRKAAYLAVRVRVGKGDFYELQVRPRGKHYKLWRKPDQGGPDDEKGRSSDIKPLKASNTLRIEAKGARITGYVNGKEVATLVDANPGGVAGRKVSFGVGSRRNSSRETVAVFDRVRVGLAD